MVAPFNWDTKECGRLSYMAGELKSKNVRDVFVGERYPIAQ